MHIANNSEERRNQIIGIFSEIEKQLLEMFISTGEDENKIKLIHPFLFERVLSYFRKEIPEQEKSVYPLFLTDLEKSPQFMQAFQSFVITVVKKAKEDNVRKVDLEYARKCAISGAFLPIYADTLLKKDSNFSWDETIVETQRLIDDILDKSVGLGKDLVKSKEISSLKKQINTDGKSKIELEEYLGRTKLLFGFLTYMNEIAGKKEFFDYIGNNIMGEIILKDYNKEYANKIISQINYFLSKDK